VCVAVVSWHWVASWGCPWGRKATRLKLSGTCKAADPLRYTYAGAWASRSHSSCCSHRRTKPAGSRSFWTCLQSTGFQEHSGIALQAQGSQACGQQEPWGLLAGCGLPGAQYSSTSGMDNRAYWLVPSITHGAKRTVGTGFPGVLGWRVSGPVAKEL
jgi:hypothetical protein